MDNLPKVCSFESRRAAEMRDLIERHNGIPVMAPSMKEVPLSDNTAALASIRQILTAKADLLILLTGVGTTAMLELARTEGLEQRLLDCMQRLPIVVRGPKPAAVLRRLGITAAECAKSPNTWQEVMAAMKSAGIHLHGRTVAVQEYGTPAHDLEAALKKQGASILPIPVYRWALPDNLQPLQESIHAVVRGELDLLLFTSAQQVRHVLQVAGELGLEEEWKSRIPAIASIGPTCSDALRENGLPVQFEANPPKMGPLVRGAIANVT